MILHRYVVSRVIWPYMLSIAVTYSITLCLFPGLESEIRNPTLGEWLPILIMATFNMSDFVGKVRSTQISITQELHKDATKSILSKAFTHSKCVIFRLESLLSILSFTSSI